MDQDSQNSDSPGRRRAPALARWPLGRVAFATFCATLALALGVLAGVLGWLGLLSRSSFRSSPGTALDVVKLVLGAVAGVGALVGLVIAYRRQLVAETADDRERTRLFNERFNAAAEQLGSDRAGVRQAGIYSMEGLADDWPAGRQKCVDVLCALARRGHVLQPPADAPIEDRLAWDDDRQFRHAIMRVVADHLRPAAAVPWRGGNFDFTGALVDGGDFEGIELTGGRLVFAGARFVAGAPLVMRGSRIVAGLLDVRGAVFDSGALDLSKASVGPQATVNFSDVLFQDGYVDIRTTTIEGCCYLCRATLSGAEIELSESSLRGTIDFRDARLAGGVMRFDGAVVAPERFRFAGARFEGATLDFSGAHLDGVLDFGTAASPAGVILPPTPTVAPHSAPE